MLRIKLQIQKPLSLRLDLKKNFAEGVVNSRPPRTWPHGVCLRRANTPHTHMYSLCHKLVRNSTTTL